MNEINNRKQFSDCYRLVQKHFTFDTKRKSVSCSCHSVDEEERLPHRGSSFSLLLSEELKNNTVHYFMGSWFPNNYLERTVMTGKTETVSEQVSWKCEKYLRD